ncbi:hypothetical protein BCR32DRAFT_224294 [Anaeromyces robustus]|jgi:hypothetical protein|uniref:Guanine nucleotide-binding protein subunit gamma n=1 Tax=Anaeromyces robustus TaxID=1754192 RepID=A0A1Y1WS66_9FUNG|nr:hypothetical protein BCR32DRAFT_224294 [Anaeromyces robustus]|eukprot:ORX76381.1 hypothetical protein BCR32DRAFT_224294 [Anaeromyces robustus]
MSYNYQSQGRRQTGSSYGQMSPNGSSTFEYDYSQQVYSPSYGSNYSPSSYTKYSPSSQTMQSQYYTQQQAAQAAYQQKQYRVQNANGGMTSSGMLYNVNPDAAMAYRQRKMQQAAERKYQKLCRLTNRLRDQLRLQTIPVSKAACSLVNYTISVKDPLLPSVWGPIEKRDNPYAANNTTCSCIIM